MAGQPRGVAVRVYRRMWHVFPMYTEACGQAQASYAHAQSQGLPHAWQALEDVATWLAQHAPLQMDTREEHEDVPSREEALAMARLRWTRPRAVVADSVKTGKLS